ncbi:hypothetical protein COL922a_010097 [Colletotrichum nupharicola]|nr:hypothetical protein COL922a_010097 [Colletotrichum nupharicola]
MHQLRVLGLLLALASNLVLCACQQSTSFPKQLAVIRRRSGLTHKEYLEYHTLVHGQKSWNAPHDNAWPIAYTQNHVVDGVFGANNTVANQIYVGRDDVNELYSSAADSFTSPPPTNYTETVIGPDGVDFNDMPTAMSMLATETFLTGLPAGAKPADNKPPLVAWFWAIATTEATSNETFANTLADTLVKATPAGTVYNASVHVPVPGGDLRPYFGGQTMPTINAVIKLWLGESDSSISAVRTAQTQLDNAKLQLDENQSFTLFSREVVIWDMRKNIEPSHAATHPTSSEIQAKEESSKPAKNKAKGAKGKKKKKRTDQAPKKYTVAVKEFIPLAQYISTAKHKSSNVPDILVSALNRVIDLRTRFSAKLTQDGAKPATASDSKHSYFLGILIQVRDVSRPRMTAAGSQASHNGLDNLANRFAGLSLFEPSQSFLNAPDIELPARDDGALYEADMGTSPEDSFFFFQMLWKDLLDLRMRIRVSWRRHMQGHDMAAAAVSANTALDLARHVIDQYIPAFEGVEGGNYAVMKEHATLMHYRVKANPTDPYFGLLKPGQPQESISDDQIMYGAGLWSFANAYNMLAELLPSIAPPGPPFPFIPRDPAHELGMEYRDYAETLAILKPLFEDLRVVIESVPNWPVEDTLLRGVREAVETRQVPFYLGFATAIISDMHNFFSQGEHLNVDNHIIDKFIETIGAVRGIVADYYAAIREAESLEEMEPYDARIREMDREIKRLLDEDPVWQAKIKKFLRRERGQAKRELEKHRLFKYNAIMCGLAL